MEHEVKTQLTSFANPSFDYAEEVSQTDFAGL